MTTDIIELSKQAVEVLGVPAQNYVVIGVNPENLSIPLHKTVWLAEDAGRCAEIAADRMIDTTWYDEGVQTIWSDEIEFYSDHNGDRKQAWRVAVLKAVIEQGKQ